MTRPPGSGSSTPPPPAYRGPLPLRDLHAARGSTNPRHGPRDLYYTGAPIGNRALDVEFPPEVFRPAAEWTWQVLRDNLRRLMTPAAAGETLSGLDGLARLAAAFEPLDASRPEDLARLDELYVFAVAMMAQRVHHARFLRRAAVLVGEPRLAGLGRLMDGITHHWSALRVLASREARQEPAAAGKRVAMRLGRLFEAEAAAAEQLEKIVGA